MVGGILFGGIVSNIVAKMGSILFGGILFFMQYISAMVQGILLGGCHPYHAVIHCIRVLVFCLFVVYVVLCLWSHYWWYSAWWL